MSSTFWWGSRVYKPKTKETTLVVKMKIITVYIAAFLCLALFVFDAAGVYEAPNAWTSIFEMWIPQGNRYLKKIKRDGRIIVDHAQWYKGVVYKRQITNESNIVVDYEVSKDVGSRSHSWSSVEKGSVDLCSQEENTQDGTIAEIVQWVIGMPGGCPGEKGYQDISWFHFATDHTFVFNEDITKADVKIEVNVHDSKGESMLKGEFFIDPRRK